MIWIFILAGWEGWHLPDTGLFDLQSLSFQVAFDREYGFFLLDREEHRILHYSVEGARLRILGGQGQGPGELQYPLRLCFQQGKLYADSLGYINVYDGAGHFLEKVREPGVAHLRKVKGGWLALRGLQYGESKLPLQLVWLSESRDRQKVLGSWASEFERLGKTTDDFRVRDVEKFNPAFDSTQLVVSQDGARAYLKPGGEPTIYIFSMLEHRLVKALTIEGPPLPFDREWARAGLEHINSESGKGARAMKWVADFPSFFPVTRTFNLSKRNYLSVWKWGHPLPSLVNPIPENFPTLILFFTPDGEPAQPGLFEKYIDRIVGHDDQWIYLASRTKVGEFTISRCIRAEVKNFLERNPWSNCRN